MGADKRIKAKSAAESPCGFGGKYRTMKYFTVLFSCAVPLFFGNAAQAGGVAADCTYNGIPLYGNVKIVDHFPDVKVQAVSRFADLRVKTVDGYANSCGRWKIVDSFPDFTVQFVEHFPDITIQIVEIYPGLTK